MSVVILGAVAMACGRRDTEAWLARGVDKVLIRGSFGPPSRATHKVSLSLSTSKACHFSVVLAKLGYFVIVFLGVVMAPLVVIFSDKAAPECNRR